MSMITKVITLTVNYPEGIDDIEPNLEHDILAALYQSDDLRFCHEKIIDIRDAEREDGEEGDA